MIRFRPLLHAACFAALWLCLAQPAAAVGTEFTWQGELRESGQPATGVYDLEFRLYAAASGGSPVGPTRTLSAQSISGGIYTALLDFGDQFTGEPRWLEISVRSTGQPTFTTLLPRQALTATPYAQHAEFVADNSIVGANIVDGSIGGADLAPASVSTTQLANGAVQSIDLADGSVTTAKIADAAVVTAKLAGASVTGGKIAVGAVGTAALADASVTAAKLSPGAIGAAQVDLDEIQRRVDTRCPTELPMIGVNSDGTPVCGNVSHLIPAESVSQPKLALRADGRPLITYIDEIGGDLELAMCGDPVCSTVVVKTLDGAAGATFLGHDLVIRNSGIPSVAYRDAGSNSLNAIDCGDADCESPTIYTLDATPGAGVGVSIALRTAAVPIISYFVDAGTDELRAFDCANSVCSSGSTRTLDTTNLDLDTATAVVVPPIGIPVVFFEGTGVEQGLNASLCGNSDCTSAGTQDLTDDFIGSLAAAVGAGGSPLVALRRNGAGAVQVFDCGGIVCSQGSSATAYTSSGFGRVDLALAADGAPFVTAYVNDRSEVYDCANEACTSGVSRVVDTIVGRGSQASIALRGDGRPVLAYEDNGRIRVTVCGNPGCVP